MQWIVGTCKNREVTRKSSGFLFAGSMRGGCGAVLKDACVFLLHR